MVFAVHPDIDQKNNSLRVIGDMNNNPVREEISRISTGIDSAARSDTDLHQVIVNRPPDLDFFVANQAKALAKDHPSHSMEKVTNYILEKLLPRLESTYKDLMEAGHEAKAEALRVKIVEFHDRVIQGAKEFAKDALETQAKAEEYGKKADDEEKKYKALEAAQKKKNTKATPPIDMLADLFKTQRSETPNASVSLVGATLNPNIKRKQLLISTAEVQKVLRGKNAVRELRATIKGKAEAAKKNQENYANKALTLLGKIDQRVLRTLKDKELRKDQFMQKSAALKERKAANDSAPVKHKMGLG